MSEAQELTSDPTTSDPTIFHGKNAMNIESQIDLIQAYVRLKSHESTYIEANFCIWSSFLRIVFFT